MAAPPDVVRARMARLEEALRHVRQTVSPACRARSAGVEGVDRGDGDGEREGCTWSSPRADPPAAALRPPAAAPRPLQNLARTKRDVENVIGNAWHLDVKLLPPPREPRTARPGAALSSPSLLTSRRR
jgi:hypothetical protein